MNSSVVQAITDSRKLNILGFSKVIAGGSPLPAGPVYEDVSDEEAEVFDHRENQLWVYPIEGEEWDVQRPNGWFQHLLDNDSGEYFFVTYKTLKVS